MEESQSMVTVVLAGHSPMMMAGIESAMEKQDDMEVVGEAADEEEALKLVQEHSPEVVVAEARLGDFDGARLARRIRRENPGTRVLIFTIHDEDYCIRRCLEAGASGYLLKTEPVENLAGAVCLVARGQTVLGERATRLALNDVVHPGLDSENTNENSNDAKVLNGRQLELLRLIAAGKTTSETALEMHVSESTVKWYLSEIFTKLDVGNRLSAVVAAVRDGLLSLEDIGGR
jgi:DNA-binding NarL/FixJ family response regulator